MQQTMANFSAENKLEGDVNSELMAQLDILDKALKENKRLYTEIKDTNSMNQLTSLEAKMAKLGRLIGDQKNLIKHERMRTAALAEKMGLDQRIGANIQRGREQARIPQYGRTYSLDYLHEAATLNEFHLNQLSQSIQKLRQLLEHLQRTEEDLDGLSRSELAAHIQRFDKIFENVATQVYTLNESTEKLRDCFLSQRKELFGRFGADPFEKRKERQRLIDAYSTLKGVDAFPSTNTILSMSDLLPRQHPSAISQPQFGTTPFAQNTSNIFGGGTGNLFGGTAKPATTPAFSFNLAKPAGQPTPSSIFGASKPPSIAPFSFGGTTTTSTATPSLFGAPVTATTTTSSALPLFGAAPAGAQPSSSLPLSTSTQQSTAPPPFGFSNTLSSASSGTLFKGSASPQLQLNKPAAGGSLFGSLNK